MTETEQPEDAEKKSIRTPAVEPVLLDCFRPTPRWLRYSLPCVITVAVILLLLIPYLDDGYSTGIVWLLASSYIFLVAGLTLIWNVGIPNGNNEKFKNFDFEVFTRDRLKATVAITSMGVLLAVIALIAYTVGIV